MFLMRCASIAPDCRKCCDIEGSSIAGISLSRHSVWFDAKQIVGCMIVILTYNLTVLSESLPWYLLSPKVIIDNCTLLDNCCEALVLLWVGIRTSIS